MGPHAGYAENAAAMLGVISKHRAAVGNIQHTDSVPADMLVGRAQGLGRRARPGRGRGFRNAQATVLAPTGTISFMMDCDTTGVEPDFSLVKSKKLVGGGELTIVNKTVPMALGELGYATARGRGDRRVHRRAWHACRRAAPEDTSTTRFRLRDRRARDPLHGSREDDGRGAAVHLGRDLEDGQPARGDDGRRGRAAPDRGLAARRQGDRDLPRQLQGRAAALRLEGHLGGRQSPRSTRSAASSPHRSAAGCRTTAPRSAASSRSASTRATFTSASSRTARPATSSWTSPRRARRSPA